jgi:glycosyltransferase involved in cell wall biosynthesis
VSRSPNLTHAPEPPDITIIVPVYREEKGISRVVEGLIRVMDGLGRSYEVLVVDDGSGDRTADRAREAGARVISHPYRIGNGAAVKTGIRNSRGSLLVMLDGDGQHDPADVPRLLEEIGPYDMVVGARTSESRTSVHRDLANWIYNWFATYMCGLRIRDLTSGFRAIKSKIARQYVYLLPNTFSYPTTITLALVRSGHSLTYVPIRTALRVGRSKLRPLRDGTRFFLIIMKVATLFSPMKVFLPVSGFMFLLGLGYGIFKMAFLDGRYGQTSGILMIMAVVVFMVGLVSEQIAQLRFDRTEPPERP